MTKFCLLFTLLIIYISYCSAGFPFRRIPQRRFNELYYIPAIIDDPDALPNGILLRLFEDHFGKRFQITNQYGTSRELPLNQLPTGYIDDQAQSNLPKYNNIKPHKKHFRKPHPKHDRKFLKIIHENSPSDLDENIINNEILRYFSLANFGLLDDEIFSFK